MNEQPAATQTEDTCTYIPYAQTGFFSKTVLDYLGQKQTLQPFYQHPVSLQGIQAAIEAQQHFQHNREALVNVLKQQYEGLNLSDQVAQNIQLLSQPDTFTITTAHQPVIFTGPLYFAYKILHAVKLAHYLSQQLPQYNFVPVFYMGSEDADLDELGTMNVDGKQYKWNTQQTGAVGRMKVDKEFIALLQQLQNQIEVLPFGNDIIEIFKRCYRLGTTIQQATLEVVNELFGEYGIVVLIPDNKDLKHLLHATFSKEIEEQFSHKEVEKTLAQLSQHYKVQAGGREVNLFYLLDDKRERIEKDANGFFVQNQNLRFTKDELLTELQQHPERFSPNVILRGVMQETILPNIAFIGGGGELAYWLELKNVFAATQVPYPVLVLRNSFLCITKKQGKKIKELGFSESDFFTSELALINEFTQRNSNNELNIQDERKQIEQVFQQLQTLVQKVDVSLSEHAQALSTATQNKLASLQSKILRSERRKYNTEMRQIQTLQQQLFPHKNLQERVENSSGPYARYGKTFFEIIYKHSLSLEHKFAILTL